MLNSVLLAGMRSSRKRKQKQFVNLLKNKLTCCRNFPRCWCISRELEDHFFGRVGLFRNQVGDELLRKADLVVAIGYDPIEYAKVTGIKN